MALFLLSTSVGNLMTAAVNTAMVRPLHAIAAEAGAETWVQIDGADSLVAGQKIDFKGDPGLEVKAAGGKQEKLAGTFLVAESDGRRVKLMDSVDRRPIATVGRFDASKAEVSTYKLVGPQYFNFFAMAMAGVGLLFILVAVLYKEKTHLRQDEPAGA